MALQYKFKTKDEIPAEHVSLYAEREGAWVLDVDGVVDKARLDEFRATNVSLLKERDELKKRFEGIDPEVARAALAERQRAEEERLLSGHGAAAAETPAKAEKSEQDKAQERERLEKVIEGRIKNVKGELDRQIEALTTERDALMSRLTSIQIDQGVTTVATKRGLRPTAIPDITARARIVFRLVNGVPQAFEADGKSVRYGKDGLTPMTVEEWVDAQVSEAPHLFESNAGGGGGGATFPIWQWRQCRFPTATESLPKGELESDGANEVAENRPATGGAIESRCLTRGVRPHFCTQEQCKNAVLTPSLTGHNRRIEYAENGCSRHHHPNGV